MPTEAKWYKEEKTIAHFIYQGKWTWEEYYEGTYALYDLMKEVENNVDIIVEYAEGSHQPQGNAFVHWKNTSEKAPPNRGIMVIVGNAITSAMTNLSNKLSGNSWTQDGYHYAKTVDAAEEHIHQYRATEDEQSS